MAGLGPEADGLAVGDEVYGLIDFDRNGAAAEFVTLPPAHPAARPRSVSHEEAATLPLAALTAWQALVDRAALQAGEQVLVQGGGLHNVDPRTWPLTGVNQCAQSTPDSPCECFATAPLVRRGRAPATKPERDAPRDRDTE